LRCEYGLSDVDQIGPIAESTGVKLASKDTGSAAATSSAI
jgi:hypothetical protein